MMAISAMMSGTGNLASLQSKAAQILLAFSAASLLACEALPTSPGSFKPDASTLAEMDAGRELLDAGAELPDGGIAEISSARLKVASWNLNWFGDPSNGPSNDALQLANVAAVIRDAGFDVWGLQEVVGSSDFNALLAKLPGYDGFIASDDTRVPGGSDWYFPRSQKVGVIFRTAAMRVVSASLVLTSSAFEFGGRPPMWVEFKVRADGGEEDLALVVLHMKALADADGCQRRIDAASALKGYLDGLSSQRVLVIGDWNDDVDRSLCRDITSGGYQPTPYQTFVDEPARYFFATRPLSLAGEHSTVRHGEMVDHHLAAMDAVARFVPGSAMVLRVDQGGIVSYATTTSDHLPVVSQYLVAPP